MFRFLLLVWIISGLASHSYGQRIVKTPYPNDIPKQRLLAISTGLHLYTFLQGQLDLDSTMLLATQSRGMSRLLPFNEGYSDGSPLPGSDLIDAGKTDEAAELANKLNGERQLAVWTQLAGYFLFKPGMNKPDLDKALVFIEKTRKQSIGKQFDKWRNESLSLLAIYHYQTMNLPESQKYFSQVTDFYRKNGNQARLALALGNQGAYLPFGHPQKLPLLEESRAIYRKLNQKEKEIEMLGKVLSEHFMTGWNSAEKELEEFIALEQKIGFRHIHFAQQSLSFIAAIKSDYVKEFFYANQAVKSILATGDYSFASIFYNSLGMAYLNVRKSKEGLYWVRKGMNENLNGGYQAFWCKSFICLIRYYAGERRDREMMALINKVTARYPPNSPYDAMLVAYYSGLGYERLKEPARATDFYNQADQIASSFPPQHIHSEVPEMYLTMADFYLTQGDRARATHYLSKAEATPNGKNSIIQQFGVSRLQVRLDSAAGNYASALAHLQRHKQIADSLQGLSLVKQMNQLMVQYETAKKDQNIKLLTQRGELQQSRIERAEAVRNATFGGIGLLLVIVGLIFTQYRTKQKKNEQLLYQQMEIHRKNEALEEMVTQKDKLLGEKEWLLKEVHHRVKNNLHTVMSLLESQSSYLESDALNALRDSQHRVQAMSLIHQKLYLSDNVTTIDMSVYLRELVTYLRDSFQTRQRVYFNLKLDSIELDIAQAIPLGLILNEAITNALKYAFPGNREGEILISIARPAEDKFQLCVADNGIGLPQNFNIEQSASLGMKLMQGLCREINGNFRIENKGGTSIFITFAIERMFRQLQENTP